MSKKRYYVVWAGLEPGVYNDIEDAMDQIDGYPNASIKSYSSPEAAAEAFRRKDRRNDNRELGSFLTNATSHIPLPADGKPDYMTFPEIDLNGWAVDASCQGNPGLMEYRGVELMTGREIFKVGPFEESTNNIGEFLAIVHALALQAQSGENHTIYSDSVTGMSWVRKKQIKTQLKPTKANEKSFVMMDRALKWLHTHAYDTKILKWQTPVWGEIPADFGRKGVK